MKICHIHIENYRSLKVLDIDTSKHNVFIGQNNSGKSNILCAIDAFYNPKKISIDDFTKDQSGNLVGREIKICLTFNDLTELEQTKNTVYFYNSQIKVELSAKLDENEKIKLEHHGYIQGRKPIFDEVLNPQLKELLEFQGVPRVEDINAIEELKKIKNEIKPTGRPSKEDWERIKNRSFEMHPEIKICEEEVLSDNQYHGFIGPNQPDTIGSCIFIPATKDPLDDLKTGGRSTQITKLIDHLCIKGTSDETKIKYGNIQKEILVEREKNIKELEGKFNDELKLWDTTVNIQLNQSEISDSFPSKAQLSFDDGVLTDMDKKGTGLQRYIFFKFLKIYSEMTLSNSISLILLFEEPESHLHPQMQREIASILRELQNQTQLNYQTFITTHSPQFIDMKTLDEIFLISKDETCCTISSGCQISWKGDKDQVKRILFFDPNVSEIFFADKIVIFEGQSEQIALNYFHEIGNLDLTNVSIIVTQSKDNISVFLDIVNKLNKPYSVMFDEDPYFLPHYKETDPDKMKGMKNKYNSNKEIIKKVDSNYGRIVICCPDFDYILGTSKNQREELGKPTATLKKLEEYHLKGEKKFIELQEIFKRLLNPQNQTENVVDQAGNIWEEKDNRNIELAKPIYANFIEKQKGLVRKFPEIVRNLSQDQKKELSELFSIEIIDTNDKSIKMKQKKGQSKKDDGLYKFFNKNNEKL